MSDTLQLMSDRNGQLVTEFVSIKNGGRFWLPNGSYLKNGLFHKDNFLFWLKETFNSKKAICAFGPIIGAWESMPIYSLPIVLVSKCDTSNEG